MKTVHILAALLLVWSATSAFGQSGSYRFSLDFYEGTVNLEADSSILTNVPVHLTPSRINRFFLKVNSGNYQPLIDSLLAYKEKHQLNDWFYYQLIRRIAQQISPKADNYSRYTLYKWFLLSKSGYDARVALTSDKIIFYVYNDEDIEDVPFFMINKRKYMCLNYHDYPSANLTKDPPIPVEIKISEAQKAFSYKVTRMPDFKPESYTEKELEFSYRQKVYHFKIKYNPEVESIFKNYPTVDFESYFNIPLSKETYQSLIPMLKENVKGMKQKQGVDYLMRFTRYAFLYENDDQNFGKEKRLSPEQTLSSSFSDCDDRASLFCYLVKEIYNLPMIALLYPTHITTAVQFDKPFGKSVIYNGKNYSVCEPTPQKEDLAIGQLASQLKNTPYQVVYHYDPSQP